MKKRINNILKKKIKVGVIGLGFVGLPLLRLMKKKKLMFMVLIQTIQK